MMADTFAEYLMYSTMTSLGLLLLVSSLISLFMLLTFTLFIILHLS